MSADWAHANFKAIFPTEFPADCLAAFDGPAFAPSMKPIFDELIATGVVDWALRQDMKGIMPAKAVAAAGPVLPPG